MGKRNQNKNKKKKKAAAAAGAERGRSENSAAAAAAVSPSPQKSSKKKKKELTVGEKMCESYARFEDYIEDWEKLSAVGEKAVRQLSGKIPAIENLPLDVKSHGVGYSQFAQNTETGIEILGGTCSAMSECFAKMTEVWNEAKEVIRTVDVSTDESCQAVLTNRGECNHKCSPADWMNFLAVQYEMYKADFEMKQDFFLSISNQSGGKSAPTITAPPIGHNEIMAMLIMWETSPAIDEEVVSYINERIKQDYVLQR
jgi:hypothetical protein